MQPKSTKGLLPKTNEKRKLKSLNRRAKMLSLRVDTTKTKIVSQKAQNRSANVKLKIVVDCCRVPVDVINRRTRWGINTTHLITVGQCPKPKERTKGFHGIQGSVVEPTEVFSHTARGST